MLFVLDGIGLDKHDGFIHHFIVQRRVQSTADDLHTMKEPMRIEFILIYEHFHL